MRFVLGSEIANAMRTVEFSASNRISARMKELAEKTLREIELLQQQQSDSSVSLTFPTIDDAVGPLLGALREAPDPAVRAFTALTLAQCNRPVAVPALIAAFADPDKVVRTAGPCPPTSGPRRFPR